MPIRKVYAKPGQDAISSYDYVDIANGTGVTKFYAHTTALSGATLYYHNLTTDSSLYSYEIEKVIGNDGMYFNLSPFQKPQQVRGTALIRFSSQINSGIAALYWIVRLYKVASGGGTTLFGEAVSAVGSGADPSIDNWVIPITLTDTHFKRGESLRLFVLPSGAGGGTKYIGLDPTNRSGTLITPASTYPTKLELFIPFKIDA